MLYTDLEYVKTASCKLVWQSQWELIQSNLIKHLEEAHLLYLLNRLF